MTLVHTDTVFFCVKASIIAFSDCSVRRIPTMHPLLEGRCLSGTGPVFSMYSVRAIQLVPGLLLPWEQKVNV